MTDTNYIPRLPTDEERKALAHHVAEMMSYMPEEHEYREAESLAERAAICVFDGYVPDQPGTTGSVMLVVWPGGVNFFEAFLIKAGEIESIAQSEELQG